MDIFRKLKSSIYIHAINFVVYNVLFFAIPFPKNSAVWIGYFFTLCSFAVSYWSFLWAFQKKGDLESRVYGFPVFRVGLTYLISQLIFGFMIDLLGCVIRIPNWIVLIVSVIFLAYALIGMIATDSTRDVIEKQQEDLTVQTEKLTYFHLDISRLADKAIDEEVKKEITKLAEDVRFSDPVSSEALKEIEERLEIEVERLEKMLRGSKEECLLQITSLSNMLADRNRRCKELKRRKSK